jgi:multicomponent Na+:H+ antiporter subunit A
MEINLLVLLIIAPLVVSILNIILPRLIQKIFSMCSIAGTIYISYMLYTQPFETASFFGTLVFSLDKLGIFTIVFIQILSFIILIFSLKGLNKDIERKFFILYPMTVAFCNGVIVSINSIAFMMFWGLSGLTLYMLGLLGNTKDTPKAIKKTFILIGGSDAFLIMGFVLIAHLLPAANWSLNNPQMQLTDTLSYTAFFFLMIAAFTKAGGFPFHTWVPDFAKDAPVESAAFLPASLDKFLGIYLLARLVTSWFVFGFEINLIIITLGSLTIITAVMMAMNQHNGKKLLGYHAVSQVGYMIMGVGSGNILAFAGGLFHMLNNTIYKSCLFLSIGSVEKKTGTSKLDDLGGLAKKMPVTFICSLIAALSISGIPPLNGFFSKWMIYQGMIEKIKELPHGFQIWLLVCLALALFGSALTLASFMKFIHAVFLGKRPSALDNITEAPFNQWIANSLLAFTCVVFGLFALQIPLNLFVYPALPGLNMSVPIFIGLYNPALILFLLGVAFLVGLVFYVFTAKVRYDNVYLGGSGPEEKFRISGTEFYNEIRNMKPLKLIYDWAEKKYFDIYEFSTKGTFKLSGIFQKAHPGQLQLYVIYMLVGLVIFLLFI